ncbi:MAG: Eco57I restriction-modification methylase domain-containing protein [Thermoplasmatota archaeon]
MAIQTKLQSLTNRDLFSNYYLENLLPDSKTWKSVDDDEVREVYENIMEIYEEHKDYVETYSEDFLEDKFIRPIFKELGLEYGTRESVKEKQRFPDYGIFKSVEDRNSAYDKKEDEDFYKNAISIAEAKRWGRNLDKRGGQRDFTNPSHQVYVYIQETPVDWAILTNGRKWRLYYSKTSHKLDSYYEVDLPTILEHDGKKKIELFKYFFLLFRAEAFVEDSRGECFLDKVYDKSNLFSQELGEDLKGNIYEAIRKLAEGFLEHPDNDLDPVEDLDLIHDSSLIYLYRLIFVLYAESEGRDLLDTTNRIYDKDYSLNSRKQEVCEQLDNSDDEYTYWQTNLWDKLEDLFELIDKGSKNMGIPKEDLYIPAYNGGLFKTDVTDDAADEVVFLQDYCVGDSYLAEVIDLLTRHESQNGEGRVFVDYSSLDIRHLGSIYEGLLEYHLNVASEQMVAVKDGKKQRWTPEENFEGDSKIVERLDEGEVYLTTDRGERKATGSYYTPEYIVQYIVENTLDPIIKEIKEDLLVKGMGNFANEFAERISELKVLDPAMGSGHFLTNAVDHLAREIVNAHQRQAEEEGAETVDESHDIHWARRQVAQKCIYGVDLNPMAVELAKVSLWLRTLAAQQPLAFLDHHLKTGNSLIGSDIEEIDELTSGSKKEKAVKSATLEDFGLTKKGTTEDLMKIYQDFIKIENQELDDIKEMEEKYHEFEHEPIKERLEAMANVHTAREFGVDVLGSAFARMAKAIDDAGKWEKIEKEDWFNESQELAGDKDFFHWKLAFPEAFYEEDGEKKEYAGFDVVIGNPPYVRVQNLESSFKEYLKEIYITPKGKFDIYIPFLEKSIKLGSDRGLISFIMPSKFKSTQYGSKLKEFIYEEGSLISYLDFSDYQVFPEVTTYTCIPVIKKSGESEIFNYSKIENSAEEKIDSLNYRSSLKESFLSKADRFLLKEEYEVKDKLSNQGKELSEISERIFTGIQTSLDEYYVLSKQRIEELGIEDNFIEKFVMGQDVRRWIIQYEDLYVIYPQKNENGKVKPVDKRTLKEESPNLWEYINTTEVKEACQRRDYLMEKVESGDRAWYDVWMRRNPEWFKENKILTPALSPESNFVVDTDQYYFTSGSAGVYSIMLKDEFDSLNNLYLVTALLNSKPLDWFIRSSSPIYRGKYFKYNTQYLEQVPLKISTEYDETIKEKSKGAHNIKKEFREEYLGFLNWIEAEWDVSLDDLALKTHLREYWKYDFDEFIRIAKKNKSQIEGKINSRRFRELMKEEWEKSINILNTLKKELNDLESETDAIVFDLYDLTEDEVETVLDSLDTPKDEREDILDKFKKVKEED